MRLLSSLHSATVLSASITARMNWPEPLTPAGYYHAQVARGQMFDEDYEAALESSDRGLIDAERLGLLPDVAELLVTKGVALGHMGRLREGVGLMEAGERLALSTGRILTAVRAEINLTTVLPLIAVKESDAQTFNQDRRCLRKTSNQCTERVRQISSAIVA